MHGAAAAGSRGARGAALGAPEPWGLLTRPYTEFPTAPMRSVSSTAPADVYATLLDESLYHCSIRTMSRLLAAHQEVRERRDQLYRRAE